jgi:hypothetical protein
MATIIGKLIFSIELVGKGEKISCQIRRRSVATLAASQEWRRQGRTKSH